MYSLRPIIKRAGWRPSPEAWIRKLQRIVFTFSLPACLAVLVPAAPAQTTFTEGDALSIRTFGTDNGPTNSQLTLDFPITQAGVFENVLTWGQTTGGNGSSVGQNFEVFVLRPLSGANFQVMFGTGYVTVTNAGTNTFEVSGAPFALQVNDVIAHYGRGIPFDNGSGGPSSVYIAPNLPPPVVGTLITVPGPVYPVYNDGGRNYAIQVQARAPLLVTNNSDNGPGSLRQAALNAAAGGGENIINFANTLAGQTILLTNGQIELNNNVAIDASALAGGVQISGNAQSRIFQVDGSETVFFGRLTFTGGNGLGAMDNGSGGAVLNLGTLTVNECTFSGNQANFSSTFGGGGIFNYGTLTVENSVFTGNQANNNVGGGGVNNYGTMTANNSTFTGNQANGSEGGGGIDDFGTLTVNNCTFIGNQANTGFTGGGIFVYGTLYLTNSIACSNLPAGADIYRDLVFGTVRSDANSLVGVNAQVAPLGSYGGPTQTMPPLPGSPAIDTGSDGVTNFLATDGRGSARKAGAHVDVGAVESGGLWVVNANDTGSGSLRFVLTNAAATVASPKIIAFVPSLSGGVINLASQLLVTDTNGVTVDASALTNGIQISGNGATRVFYVTNGAVATLNSLTIDYGLASDGDFAPGGGGSGLLCGGQVALLNCSVVNNLAIAPYNGGGAATGLGAGITCDSGYVALTNCTVANNEVFGPNGWGGAFYNFFGTLILEHCTVVNNLAATVNGGVVIGGSTMLHATVLANGNTDLDNFGGGISLGDNFVSDGASSGLANGVNGDQIFTGGNPAAAHLAPLGGYGGPTPTMLPLPGSPVIDAGGPPVTATDQRGAPRLLGRATDIGAVEGIYNTNSETLTGTKQLGNGSVQFSFTNLTDENFSVLASTNITLSLGAWTMIGSAVENPIGSGSFQFTDPGAINYPQRFYRVTSR